MDSVNPDYLAAWIQKGSLSIPAWIYPDNFIAGLYEYPLLNSLYGGNSTAYLAILFFKIFGFGVVEVRLFHSLLGIATLLSIVWCLLKWRIPKYAVFLFVTLLASDPSYIYAWRTQYYLQLYPLIWFFLGIGLLGTFFDDEKNNEHKFTKVFLAGALIGFSAYSYFIFAIYAASIAVLFFLIVRKYRIKSSFYFVAGLLIGFMPYIYAHASIIANTDFSFWVNQIKGLQTAYGVVDTDQGGLIERLYIVASRLEQLVFGIGVESTIFGSSEDAVLSSFVALGLLSFFIFFYRLRFFSSLKFLHEREEVGHIFLSFLATFISVCILFHLIFGAAIGKPLGLQHYIMLIPVVYFFCAVLFSKISYLKLSSPVRLVVKSAAFVLAACILTINILSGHRISYRLMTEGGNGLYSEAINTTGLYLQSVPTKTALLFPQWGYWMGVVTITGARHPVFHALNVEEMEIRLKTDPELKKINSFILVLGLDYFRGSDFNVDPKDLAERNGLTLRDVTTIYGRNNIDKVLLLHLSRTES